MELYVFTVPARLKQVTVFANMDTKERDAKIVKITSFLQERVFVSSVLQIRDVTVEEVAELMGLANVLLDGEESFVQIVLKLVMVTDLVFRMLKSLKDTVEPQENVNVPSLIKVQNVVTVLQLIITIQRVDHALKQFVIIVEIVRKLVNVSVIKTTTESFVNSVKKTIMALDAITVKRVSIAIITELVIRTGIMHVNVLLTIKVILVMSVILFTMDTQYVVCVLLMIRVMPAEYV